ncbi:MAG TPA: restriction endonuclease subunit S [Nostocaceae cyanobacterium]|nr:restriction endonuclease subunit S [Nostocaceae cyanobacterium]
MHNKTIPHSWIHCSLGDAIKRVVGGGTPSRSVPAYWDGSIPWASVKDFSDDTKRLYDTEEHISSIGLANSAANLIEAGTPIVCTRMAVGRSALAVRPIAINQDLKALYPQDNLNDKYLLILLEFLRPQLESLSTGTTVKGINIDQLLKIPVSFPSVPEQRFIAEILDTLDETIAHTTSIIAKLKQIKAGLLHDLLTRGLDENGELRDAIAHPEQFKDSPLGRISKDWDVKVLNSLASKIIDGTHFTPTYVEDGIPFLRVTDIQTSQINFERVKRITVREHIFLTKRCNPEFGDILYSKNGTIGITKVIDWHEEFSIFVSLCLIKPIKSLINPWYLAEILQAPIVTEQIRIRSKQMTVINLHLEEIRDFLIPVPSLDEQKRIIKALSIHDNRIREEEAYLEKLKLQKKGLMHDLLTGKVRVNQVKNNLAIPVTA